MQQSQRRRSGLLACMHAHYDYDCPTLRSCCGNLEVQIVAQTRVLEAAARALVLGLPLPLKLKTATIRYSLAQRHCTSHMGGSRLPQPGADALHRGTPGDSRAAAGQYVRACAMRSYARQQRCEPVRRGCVKGGRKGRGKGGAGGQARAVKAAQAAKSLRSATPTDY